jgi:hypothetical protein
MRQLSTCNGACIVDRPDDEPGGAGVFTKAYFPTHLQTWAWLHTLRTGERSLTVTDVDRHALQELTRFKEQALAKPPPVPKFRALKRLRSHRQPAQPEKDDGPSVA